ncbi:hypothetical protein CCR85_02815 [Rhodothalassium salexigens]|uniref:RadC family protein n=1 Tax=Rhodothalassium salexigens TaxID=1086 RepID=UPI001F5D62C9|nr:DNA repair protein RadC [Rhodothalassium salexigens]MBK5910422.1 hypothetical protein [Rhodothalassium salexigens]
MSDTSDTPDRPGNARPPSRRRPAASGAVAGPAPHYAGHRDRLRQRFRDGGAAALQDYELLELLLFLSIPRRDVKPLAKDLIARFSSLAGVLSADLGALRAAGLSERSALALKTVQAAGLTLAQAEVIDRPVVSSWQALLDYCRAAMGRSPVEQTRILFLDRKNRLIADEVQQTGTVDHTPLYPREVIKRALDLHASAIIMVHNHPSGDATPSRADIEITRQVQQAGKQLGVILHDHIIIARGEHASFKSMGLI